MTVVLVLITALFFILIHGVLRRRMEQGAVPVAIPVDLELAKNHIWIREQGEGNVRIGIDRFLSRLMGPPDSLVLPIRRTPVSDRAHAMTLRFGTLAMPLASPVTGSVVSVNRKAVNNPGLVRDDPYGKGWLLEIRRDPERDRSSSYLVGEPTPWLAGQIDNAIRFFMGKGEMASVATAQDGGALLEGLVWQYGPEVREEFIQRFASLHQE